MKRLVYLVLISGLVLAQSSMAAYYNTATVRLKAGTEARYFEAAAKYNIVFETAKEAGNLGYVLLANKKNLKDVVFKEIWKTQADLEAHLGTPHMAAFFKSINFDLNNYTLTPDGKSFVAKPGVRGIVIEKLTLDGYQD